MFLLSGTYALAAARALYPNEAMEAKAILERSLQIVSEIRVFTNQNITALELGAKARSLFELRALLRLTTHSSGGPMKRYLCWQFALTCGLVFVAAGCNQGLGVHDCQTAIDPGYSSPATGVLTLTGRFLQAESVILGYTDGTGTHALPLTPPTDRSQLSWTGLPSGTRAYTIRISCESGELDFDETYTVK